MSLVCYATITIWLHKNRVLNELYKLSPDIYKWTKCSDKLVWVIFTVDDNRTLNSTLVPVTTSLSLSPSESSRSLMWFTHGRPWRYYTDWPLGFTHHRHIRLSAVTLHSSEHKGVAVWLLLFAFFRGTWCPWPWHCEDERSGRGCQTC